MLQWIFVKTTENNFHPIVVVTITKKDIKSCLQVQIEELNLPSKDRKEDKNIGISHFRVVVVNEVPSRGMKRLYKFNKSYIYKELSLNKNYGSMNFDLQLVLADPSPWGQIEIKTKKGNKVGLRMILLISPQTFVMNFQKEGYKLVLCRC